MEQNETRIIAIVNQKGGVGKTTTAMNLAAGLVLHGKKVLCIDYDPQCHLAKYLGHTFDNAPTITDYVFAKACYDPYPAMENLIRHSAHGFDYIPGSLRLSKADRVLAQAMFPERVLRNVMEDIILEGYDYILIDCNPSMGLLMTNALVAATHVLIPVQTEEFSVDGLEDMLQLIQMVKENINPNLEILGMIPTLMTRTSDSREVYEWLHREFPSMAFKTGIGRYAAAPKSVKKRCPVIGTKGKLADQYMAATVEVLERLEG